MSGHLFSHLQYWTDQILVVGVDSKVERYFLEEAKWSKEEFTKLVYACHLWRSAVTAEEHDDKNAFFQQFAGALTVLPKASLRAVMPNRLSIVSDGDMADYLDKDSKEARKHVGEKCFNTSRFQNFKYEVKDVEVNRADIKNCRWKVKYICPKGIIIRFEEKILYLVERAVKKEKVEQSFFPAIPSQFKHSKTLKARREKVRNDLPWDDIYVQSVARAIRFDPVHDAFVSKDNVVYVELGMSSETAKKCRTIGGDGALAITAKSNLKHYVPSERWKTYQTDIEKNLYDFEKTNKSLLSPEPRTKKTAELRKAYGDLVSYFGNPKNPVAITSDPLATSPRPGGRSDEDNSVEDIKVPPGNAGHPVCCDSCVEIHCQLFKIVDTDVQHSPCPFPLPFPPGSSFERCLLM